MKLEEIRIATPCPANWADMAGDERRRFCGLCKLHVYDLSKLSRPEAEALVSTDAKICVRLYRRKDGTVLTQDCPVGLRAATRRFVAKMAASVALLFGALLWGMHDLRDGDRFDWGRLAKIQPFKAIASLINWTPEPTPVPLTGSPMPPAAVRATK